MQILKYDDLQQGGFAGLLERRFVTDIRLFGSSKEHNTADGIGNFVYLADANFNPKGETGLHPHHEIDVISVMVEGRVDHAGSLEHGQQLTAGMVQVQRAGGEGFTHNEINPDDKPNHMIQIWIMPDEIGEPADYQVHTPKIGERLQVYGGDKNSTKLLYSKTAVDVAIVKAEQTITHDGDVIVYICKGGGVINGETQTAKTLVRTNKFSFTAQSQSQLILIYTLS
ncbi:MAG: pirin family protein [Magnetococcales bacterium]|nr:pirin family protein [Magnetococcales bacterium]